MRAVIYMRVGNPEQIAAQHPEKAPLGQILDACGDGKAIDTYDGNRAPDLYKLLQKNKIYREVLTYDMGKTYWPVPEAVGLPGRRKCFRPEPYAVRGRRQKPQR